MAAKPTNIKALETGTGQSWEFWQEFLESIHEKDHQEEDLGIRVTANGP